MNASEFIKNTRLCVVFSTLFSVFHPIIIIIIIVLLHDFPSKQKIQGVSKNFQWKFFFLRALKELNSRAFKELLGIGWTLCKVFRYFWWCNYIFALKFWYQIPFGRRHFLKNLNLFQTKMCYSPYSILNLKFNYQEERKIPSFRPWLWRANPVVQHIPI